VAVPPAPDDRSGVTSESSPDGPARTPARSLRLALLVGLLVLLVAAVAAVGYLGATRPVPALGIEGDQAQVQSEREAVMAQAEQFMLRINTYGPDMLEGDTMPKYREQVEEVITAKFAADFEKNAPLAEATVKQAGVGRTAQVYSTGVSAIDSDSATALVAGSFTQSYPASDGSDQRVETEPAPFRVQVSLRKIKGTWLVDDFTALTGDAGDTGQGGGTGTPSEVPSVVPSGSTAPSGGATP
jgi:Mce-associated membrane protein